MPESVPRRVPAAETPAQFRPIAVVPCFNVGDACRPVVEGLREVLGEAVVAVDDGSTDGTGECLSRCRVEVLRHPTNRGKGAALITAFHWALEQGFDAVLTVDGDGQHDPREVPRLLEAFLREGADIVIGVREVALGKAPFRSWLGNAVSGGMFSWLSGTGIRDCQSGFRVYSRRLIQKVLPTLRAGRYETEMDLLCEALRLKARICPVPIRTIYTRQSRKLSHFAPLPDTLRVLRSMGRGLLRLPFTRTA